MTYNQHISVQWQCAYVFYSDYIIPKERYPYSVAVNWDIHHNLKLKLSWTINWRGSQIAKNHRGNMGPTWVLSAPGGTHVVPINLVIRGDIDKDLSFTTLDLYHLASFWCYISYSWFMQLQVVEINISNILGDWAINSSTCCNIGILGTLIIFIADTHIHGHAFCGRI